MTPAFIPVLFAVAMASEGLAGLLLGRLSDRAGTWLLAVFPIAGLVGAILLFLLPGVGRWLGAVVWGVGLGVQAVLLRAQIARTVGGGRRGEAFGLLDTAMGASWFAGSMILGALYGLAPAGLSSVQSCSKWRRFSGLRECSGFRGSPERGACLEQNLETLCRLPGHR
ncbi:MAG: hypothetical protein ACRES9_02220 [Gammaproteobacteria bacterium]